jgi:hypothetical protein
MPEKGYFGARSALWMLYTFWESVDLFRGTRYSIGLVATVFCIIFSTLTKRTLFWQTRSTIHPAFDSAFYSNRRFGQLLNKQKFSMTKWFRVPSACGITGKEIPSLFLDNLEHTPCFVWLCFNEGIESSGKRRGREKVYFILNYGWSTLPQTMKPSTFISLNFLKPVKLPQRWFWNGRLLQ